MMILIMSSQILLIILINIADNFDEATDTADNSDEVTIIMYYVFCMLFNCIQ